MSKQLQDRFLKRLEKKAKRGMRGWPLATIAYYGPDYSRASKVVASIMPSTDAAPLTVRTWKCDSSDVRADPVIAQEILEFIELNGAPSVVVAGAVMGCPHQQGIDTADAHTRRIPVPNPDFRNC